MSIAADHCHLIHGIIGHNLHFPACHLNLLQMDQVTARKMDLEVNAGMLAVTGGNVQQLEGECKMGELTYQGQVGSEMKEEAPCHSEGIIIAATKYTRIPEPVQAKIAHISLIMVGSTLR